MGRVPCSGSTRHETSCREFSATLDRQARWMRRYLSKRYTVVLADRNSGSVRRFTMRVRSALAVVTAAVAVPIVMGLSARWNASAEVERLQLANATLEMENTTYRTATGQLTAQIAALQTTLTDLGERADLEPAVVRAINNLPAGFRSSAMGDVIEATAADGFLASMLASPETTFGLLRDLLFDLERRLQTVRRAVERRETLAAATPSVWPAHGWLSSTYGYRTDPLSGERAFHAALDISTLKGQPVFATAAGTVQTAAYSGAYGNLVVINHGFGLATRYGHLSRFAVERGAEVERGQVIGYVGSTGRATSSHVHYEVWINGRSVNPLPLLPSSPRAAN